MKQSTTRLVIDILLVALLVFEMLYLVTGNVLHEIFGIAFFGTIGAHLILTRRMSGGLLKRAFGRGGAGKPLAAIGILRLVLALLLALDGLVLLISSVAISNVLAGVGVLLAVGDAYELWSLVHIGSAYALCGLVVLHAAAHWATFFKGSSIPYNPARRRAIQSWVMGGAAIGAAMLGVTSVVPLSSRLNSAFADESDSASSTESDGTTGSEQNGTTPSQGSLGGAGSAGSTGTTDDGTQGSPSLRKGERGYGRGTRGYSGGSEQAYGGSSSSGGGENDALGDSSSTPDGSSGGNGSGSSSTSGYCTLCPKRCSLSSPRCNRPYAAGLL